MKQAIIRIDELQQEVTDKAGKIEGAKEYVEQQMKLFNKATKHRKQLSMIIQKQDLSQNSFEIFLTTDI